MKRTILHILQGCGGQGIQQQRIKKVLDEKYNNITVSFRNAHQDKIISLDFPAFLDEEFIFTKNLFYLLRLSNKMDIIIFHNLFNYSSLLAYLIIIFIFPSKQNIVVYHNNISGYGNKLKKLYYIIRKIMIKTFVTLFADKIIFLTADQKKGYENLFLFRKRFENKSEINNNFLDEKYILKNKKNNYNEVKILFIGRLSYLKGFHDLLILMDLFKNDLCVEFGIVGKGALENKIPNYNNVKYFGRVHHNKIYDVYDNYNILIIPSYTEVFPLIILEAMARGLVILISDITGMREIIKEGRNGYFFNPNDINKMEEIIRFLNDNPSEMECISKNNLEDIWQYTPKVQGKKYLRIIEKLR